MAPACEGLGGGLAPIQLDDALETVLRRVAEALASASASWSWVM